MRFERAHKRRKREAREKAMTQESAATGAGDELQLPIERTKISGPAVDALAARKEEDDAEPADEAQWLANARAQHAAMSASEVAFLEEEKQSAATGAGDELKKLVAQIWADIVGDDVVDICDVVTITRADLKCSPVIRELASLRRELDEAKAQAEELLDAVTLANENVSILSREIAKKDAALRIADTALTEAAKIIQHEYFGRDWEAIINAADEVAKALSSPDPASPSAGVRFGLEERDDDAFIFVQGDFGPPRCLCRRPKLMSNDEWRSDAHRILAALALPHQTEKEQP